MPDIAFGSATVLAKAIRGRRIGCRELLDLYLARIERCDRKINAVVTLDAERARERAASADEALARGERLGPLHGLPMTIKDSFETAALRTTSGARELANHVPERDADAVARLVAGGAVVFGKTNLPTYAGDAQSYNAVFGTTNNPWDLSRSPGGSSGGAAAALAAGLTALELGSDIGGSIRNPAHYCGVYGHKPSYGIVPLRGHIPGPPGQLSEPDIAVAGPMARSADDLELALDVLAGPSEDRAAAWKLALPPPRRTALREYRIGAWIDDPAFPIDGPVRDRLEAAVGALRKAGAEVDDRARPGFELAEANEVFLQLLWPIIAAGFSRDQFQQLCDLATRAQPSDRSPMAELARAATIRHRDWLSANERRERMRRSWRAFFERYDVLLAPIVPTAALKHDQSEPPHERVITVNGRPRSYWDQLAWAGVFGIAYLPATVAPLGRTASGLPVGGQIVGPRWGDRTTIDFARRLADVVGGFEPPPAFAEA